MDALINAGTALLGVEMRTQWRQAVRMHLAIALDHAATVLAADLPDLIDLAPIFRA